MVRISSFQATLEAWKSIEWPSLFLGSLTRVMVNRSPTLPRRAGPGTLPLKLQACCLTPGATSKTPSVAVSVTLCSFPPGAGARWGSYGCQAAGGVALGSSLALSSTLASACSAAAAAAAGAGPLTRTSKVIPASLWPGMEHSPIIDLVTVPTSSVAVWPVLRSGVFGPPSIVRLWGTAPSFTTSSVTGVPAGTSTTLGMTSISLSSILNVGLSSPVPADLPVVAMAPPPSAFPTRWRPTAAAATTQPPGSASPARAGRAEGPVTGRPVRAGRPRSVAAAPRPVDQFLRRVGNHHGLRRPADPPDHRGGRGRQPDHVQRVGHVGRQPAVGSQGPAVQDHPERRRQLRGGGRHRQPSQPGREGSGPERHHRDRDEHHGQREVRHREHRAHRRDERRLHRPTRRHRQADLECQGHHRDHDRGDARAERHRRQPAGSSLGPDQEAAQAPQEPQEEPRPDHEQQALRPERSPVVREVGRDLSRGIAGAHRPPLEHHRRGAGQERRIPAGRTPPLPSRLVHDASVPCCRCRHAPTSGDWRREAWGPRRRGPTPAGPAEGQQYASRGRGGERRAMGTAITVEGLRKAYGPLVAVEDVSFEVAAGEIFGVLGPNGSGKTTTVECVQGLRRADAGHVRVLGLDPRMQRHQLRQRIGSQLQESALPDRIKVWEALRLFASLAPGAADWAELVERWGLAAKRNATFASLSGGQRQRLFVALALVNRPEVVFLDEMTTGLDPAARRET